MKHNGFKTRRNWLFAGLLLAAFSILLYQLARCFPQQVDRYYTQILFRTINMPLKWLTGLFPFSIGELLLYIGLLWFLFHTLRVFLHTIWNLLRKQPHPFHNLGAYGMLCVTLAAFLLSGFVLFGGLNYNSLTFVEKTGYELRESSLEELQALCRELADKAAHAREQLPENGDGVVQPESSLTNLLSSAKEGYDTLSLKYDFLGGRYPDPKPVMLSKVMCYFQITGIYPYLVPEALVNYKTPLVSLPSTICHEMAHQRGFAREDEANYIAYLACIHHSDPLFVYSGYYLAFTYSMNALYRTDRDAWQKIAEETEAGIYRDVAHSNEFWKQFDRPENILANLSEAINDSYLQANHVKDGIQSYGRVVDLLLAERRERLMTEIK